MSEYEDIINEQGMINHEYNNQLMVISAYINDSKKLREYLKTIIEDHRTGQNFKIRQLSFIPNGGLKELLYYKIDKMKKNNVKCFLYVDKDVKETVEKMDTRLYSNVSKIFGVLIDNAIDASINSEDKEVVIDIKSDNNIIKIIVKNSYSDINNTSKIGTERYTTKGKGHGFGLLLVNKIVKKCNNINVTDELNDDYYEKTIIINT